MTQEWCDKAKCPLHAAAGSVTYAEWFWWLTITTPTAVKAAASCHSQHQVTWRDHVTRSESDTSYLRLHTWAAEDNGDVNRWRSCQCHSTCLPASAINYSVVHPRLIFTLSLRNALFSRTIFVLFCPIKPISRAIKLYKHRPTVTIITSVYTPCRHSA